ncbi:MAG: hypothetical protein IH857_03665 [Deltaproteobacteria bacterium]|nr:hypothetical protein [Deltaproteobacteria bacterium]
MMSQALMEITPTVLGTAGAFMLASGLTIKIPEADKEFLNQPGATTTAKIIQRPRLVRIGLAYITVAAIVQIYLVLT